jgi:hypothetical protein
MIVRFYIDQFEAGRFDYRVTHEGEDLYADAGLASIEDCISAAIDGLGQDALGAEIAYKNILSGTYPLASLALMTAQIAQHAENTTDAIEALLRQPLGD